MNKLKGKNIFLNGSGEVRTGMILAIAAGMYGVVAAGVPALYWQIYSAMMGVWEITAENVLRAPVAVQLLYRWSGVLEVLIQNALLLAVALGLRRILKQEKRYTPSVKELGIGAGLGGGMAVLLWGVLMMLDCIRLGWRLSQPAFSVNTMALILTTGASAVCEGYFLYGTLFGAFKKRLPQWAALGMTAVFGAYMALLTDGVYCMVNGALSVLVCCLLAEGGNWLRAAGFRFGWKYLSLAVLGFAGAGSALYESYPVNLYWLNGGDMGPESGLMMTVVLLGVLAVTGRKQGMFSQEQPEKNGRNDKAPA